MNRIVVNNGFTLIELLVVVVLLGILAAFAYGTFQNYTGNAQTNVDNYLLGTVTAAVTTCETNGQGTCNKALSELLPDAGGGVVVANGVPAPAGTVTNTNDDCVITVSSTGDVSMAACSVGSTQHMVGGSVKQQLGAGKIK